MEISAEKIELMTNSADDIQREITLKGQKLGTVTGFKYLRTVVSDDGSKNGSSSNDRVSQCSSYKAEAKFREITYLSDQR